MTILLGVISLLSSNRIQHQKFQKMYLNENIKCQINRIKRLFKEVEIIIETWIQKYNNFFDVNEPKKSIRIIFIFTIIIFFINLISNCIINSEINITDTASAFGTLTIGYFSWKAYSTIFFQKASENQLNEFCNLIQTLRENKIIQVCDQTPNKPFTYYYLDFLEIFDEDYNNFSLDNLRNDRNFIITIINFDLLEEKLRTLYKSPFLPYKISHRIKKFLNINNIKIETQSDLIKLMNSKPICVQSSNKQVLFITSWFFIERNTSDLIDEMKQWLFEKDVDIKELNLPKTN